MLGPYVTFRPEQYGLVSKIQSAGAVRLSARIAVRGCRYGGGCGSAGCQKETGKAVEPPMPALSGHEKTAAPTGAAAPCFVVFSMQLAFLEAFGVYTRFKTAWVLVPFRISETQASVSLTFEKVPENACLVHWFQYLSSYLFCFTRSFAWLKPYSLERIRFASGMPSF